MYLIDIVLSLACAKSWVPFPDFKMMLMAKDVASSKSGSLYKYINKVLGPTLRGSWQAFEHVHLYTTRFLFPKCPR